MGKRDAAGHLYHCCRCDHQWVLSMKHCNPNAYCPECDKSKTFPGFVEILCSVNEREFCTYELMSLGLAKQVFF